MNVVICRSLPSLCSHLHAVALPHLRQVTKSCNHQPEASGSLIHPVLASWGCKRIQSLRHGCRLLHSVLRQHSALVQPQVERVGPKHFHKQVSSDMTTSKYLVAFDFDHTVVDGNTDTWILRALPGDLPVEIKDTIQTRGWTAYMAGVLEYMHSQGVTADVLRSELNSMTLTPGMKDLLQFLGQSDMFDCIIISDSNSMFIEWILEDTGLAHVFKQTYTNPAKEGTSGVITIHHHHAHTCTSCPANLCKTEVLAAYVEGRKQQGVQYLQIAYVGDGSNDFCPCCSLGEGDFAFPRVGFALEKQLGKTKPKCAVHAWSDAAAILEVLTKTSGSVS